MRWVAIVFGIGLLRPAPGTWASLAALPAALLLLWLGGPAVLVVGIVVAVAAGIPAIQAEVAASGIEDPRHVVIDEVAGQWVALLPVAFGAWSEGVPYHALWPGWIAAFLLFRLFDVWKPGPIGWADRHRGVFGVLVDDLLAGVFAALGVVVLGAAVHWLMV